MKKTLGVLLVLVMVVSSMTTMAFAADEVAYPNFYGSVWVENYDCIHKTDAEVSIKISKEGMEDIVIPLPYDEEFEENVIETTVEGVDDIIKEVGPVYDAAFLDENMDYVEPLTIMEELGYTVEVVIEDNDDDHEFLLEDAGLYVDVLTYESVKATLNSMVETLEEIILEYDPTYEPVGSFDALLEMYKEVLMNPDGWDMTEEEAEEELADIMYLEAMLAALESGEYAGQLMISATIPCECLELIEYTLYHEYYDGNDEYVAQEMLFPRVPNGEVIKVEDLEYVTEYDGVEYEVEGVYLIDNETWEADWENPIEEFTAVDYYDEETDEYYWTEVVIKYVPVSEDLDSELGDGGSLDDNGGVTGEGAEGEAKPEPEAKPEAKPEPQPQPTPETEEVKPAPETDVPPTGDATNLGLYIALMFVAAFVMKKAKA